MYKKPKSVIYNHCHGQGDTKLLSSAPDTTNQQSNIGYLIQKTDQVVRDDRLNPCQVLNKDFLSLM